MRALAQKISALARDSHAATAVEYGLIIALVVVAICAAVMALGTTTSNMWDGVSSKVQATTPGQ